MELRTLFSRPMAKSALALLLTLGASNAMAAGLTDGLVQCDPSFFKNLYSQRSELAAAAKVGQDDKRGLAWLPVSDRNETETATQRFAKPVDDKGLKLTGYYDRIFDLGEAGTYYFWGFETDASREAVMARLPQAQWQEAGEYFISRPQIKLSADTAWKDNPGAASGIAPAKGSAEKLLLLSIEDGKTRLMCSLQGSVDAALLQQERPDMTQGTAQ